MTVMMRFLSVRSYIGHIADDNNDEMDDDDDDDENPQGQHQ